MGAFRQRRWYRIKIFNSIDFSKSMHYNPLAYIKNEADILKFVDALISNTKSEDFLIMAFVIRSMQQLHEQISDLNTCYYDLRGEIVKAKRRIATLTERSEMCKQYDREPER